MANSASYSNFDLEDRLAASRHFAQILTDMLEGFLARNPDEEADRLLFMAYQANAAAREADEAWHLSISADAIRKAA